MEDIKINKNDALRYMGFREAPDDKTSALIDLCEERLLNAAKPRYVWRVFDVERSEGALRLSGCGFALDGESIRGHLNGCAKAAVIAATLSADADKFLKKAALEDGLTGLACDALASAYTESVSEKARAEVLERMGGFSGTWVFAAGYGDFPLETARFLVECADAGRRIGISCTESSMLIPQKTIVGIMGLSESALDPARRSCDDCNMRGRCQFRKNGGHCGTDEK
ncbi:MAG: methionine synthase [Oscillospiraceae bacterium]|nr:methionine synthase [Oscillospiraceae bacterium]